MQWQSIPTEELYECICSIVLVPDTDRPRMQYWSIPTDEIQECIDQSNTNVAKVIVVPMPNRLICDATLATAQRTVMSLEEQCGGPGRVSLLLYIITTNLDLGSLGSDQNEVANCNRFSEDPRPQQSRFHLTRGQCPNAPPPLWLPQDKAIHLRPGFCKPSEQRSQSIALS